MKKIIICLRSFSESPFALVAFRYARTVALPFLDSIVIEIKKQDYTINNKVINGFSEELEVSLQEVSLAIHLTIFSLIFSSPSRLVTFEKQSITQVISDE